MNIKFCLCPFTASLVKWEGYLYSYLCLYLWLYLYFLLASTVSMNIQFCLCLFIASLVKWGARPDSLLTFVEHSFPHKNFPRGKTSTLAQTLVRLFYVMFPFPFFRLQFVFCNKPIFCNALYFFFLIPSFRFQNIDSIAVSLFSNSETAAATPWERVRNLWWA